MLVQDEDEDEGAAGQLPLLANRLAAGPERKAAAAATTVSGSANVYIATINLPHLHHFINSARAALCLPLWNVACRRHLIHRHLLQIDSRRCVH